MERKFHKNDSAASKAHYENLYNVIDPPKAKKPEPKAKKPEPGEKK